MFITAASNVASLGAQRNLGNTSQALGKIFQQLSSGLRINSASDDPAGLALADKLNSDAKVATVALRNANDGISAISIADAALSEVGNILSRMAELATQSANGVYTNDQRSALSTEFLALGSEIERIATTTQFNNVKLLSNSSSMALQVGLDSSSNSVISIGSVLGTLASLGLAASGKSSLTYSITADTVTNAQSAAQNALTAVTSAISTLSLSRGVLGAAESRLNSAINALSSMRDHYLEAESRIRDVDVAWAAGEMVRLQIMQQAGTAVLAQANQQPARVLDLLK
jgi:flagellin